MVMNFSNLTSQFLPANNLLVDFLNPQPSNVSAENQPSFVNDTAFNFMPLNFNDRLANYNNIMDNISLFKGVLSTANDGLSAMKEQGESIRTLIEKARSEDFSEESIAAIQDEVNARLDKIKEIKANAEFNGFNPFSSPFSLTVPNWQDFLGVQPEESEGQEEKPITDVIAEINVDMNFGVFQDGSEFNMGGTAAIKIGYTDDGSLQITVDTAFDFDLSGISELGVQSDGAMDIINNFINLLTGKSNGINSANNLMNSFIARGTASIIGDGFAINAMNDINMESESSDKLKGQIVQHAAITLDSTANQSPSIAINLL